LDILPTGVLLTDLNGRFVQTNDIFQQIFDGELPPIEGFNDYQKIKAWWSDTGILLRAEDWGIYRAIKGGETSIDEVMDIEHSDGTIGTIVISSAPVKDDRGRIVGAISALQDITDHRRLERIAEEALERNKLYIDVLSHDVTNLNAAALGYLQLLEDLKELSEKQRAWVTSSIQAIDEVTRLIEKLNQIHLVGSGEEARVLDLNNYLLWIKQQYDLLSGREITIDYSGTEAHEVMATSLLSDIFSSILENAILHSTGPLTIRIVVDAVERKGRRYKQVSIEDNGPGIPDEMKERVFSRVRRGTTKGVGTGLGLFLVKRLVEGMSGEIRVEDRVPGDHSKGARFVVLLPSAPLSHRKEIVDTA
jgi:signal transduction histidine kinase